MTAARTTKVNPHACSSPPSRRALGGAAGHDDALYRRQIAYLLAHSRFYREKLAAAGFANAAAVGGLDAIAALPFTEKDELRASRSEADPVGTHLAAAMTDVVRIYSTSGTTGTPSYIPLTAVRSRQLGRRSHRAAMLPPGSRAASADLHLQCRAFRCGCGARRLQRARPLPYPCRERQYGAADGGRRLLRADILALTPSYAFHLAEWASARHRHWRLERRAADGCGRARRRRAGHARTPRRGLGASVTEAMGIGDISASLWGECEQSRACTSRGRGLVHFELVDPESGAAVPIEDGARGELVYTHLAHRAAPLLRFRSRDHVEVRVGPCACGRTAPRVRCIGRTDDMLIVRGVNVFPSAVREVVDAFAPKVSGAIAIRPRAPGVRQEPPLPIRVETGEVRRAIRRSRKRSETHPRNASGYDGHRTGAARHAAAHRLQGEARRLERGVAGKAIRRPRAPQLSTEQARSHVHEGLVLDIVAKAFERRIDLFQLGSFSTSFIQRSMFG